ncbi:MAG: hypothetical protein ACF8TS_21290 [Maioricimonas sp. JB049]
MRKNFTEHRFVWLATGMIFGLALAYYWPHEPAYADDAAMGDKFAMCTVNTLAGNSEAIFVLDFVTGRLLGAAYNTQTGTFTQTYARSVASDFKVAEDARYVIVPGQANLRTTGGGPPASGVIYVGELNSGLVSMYGFSYVQSPRQLPVQGLTLIAQLPWRQASR